MYKPYIMKYPFNALEPHISEKTQFHHYNIYLNYLDNLNRILIKNNFDFSYPVESIYCNIDKFPIEDRDSILYNAGGVINHQLYFDSMSPEKETEIPEPLHSALVPEYGSIERFKNKFITLAEELPGSGNTHLVLKPNMKLYIIDMSNQDSPYNLGMIPLLSLDVWEHAYYLDDFSDRKKYIEAFFKVASFTNANNRYKENINNLSK